MASAVKTVVLLGLAGAAVWKHKQMASGVITVVSNAPIIRDFVDVSQISEAGINHLIQSEAVRNKAYYDEANKLTIGVGHLITSVEKITGLITIDGKSVRFESGLSDVQVFALLRQDLKRFNVAVDSVDKLLNPKLNQNQFDALVSFAFNVGTPRFLTSTLVDKLYAGDYSDVPNQMKRWKYVTINGVVTVSQGLVNRRERESALWLAA